MNSDSDNHYIPDVGNFHIDTSKFEKELNELYGDLAGDALEEANLWDRTYQNIITRISNAPAEPDDDRLICRYLTPTKFIWFAHQANVYFGSANNFEDKRDSDLPEGYKNSVLKSLRRRGIIPLSWDAFLDTKRSHWLISCWTSLDNHYDDYLLWHRYAGNEYGVGIVIKYGIFRNCLRNAIETIEHVVDFQSGYVSYTHPLRSPPFNKRKIFRNEKEVRFVCSTDLLASIPIDVTKLKQAFSLRFSPDAPVHHVDAICRIWTTMGGRDEYHISGD